jgi:hypothetical protein
MPTSPLPLHSRGLASLVLSYNLKEAIIQGMVAVRAVLLAISSLHDEELDLAAKNIKRQARIAAHYAIAHLGQGGKAPQPKSREAKENVIRLVLARIDQTPRSLKSLPGGAIHSTAKKRDRPASGAVLKPERSRDSVAPRETSSPIIRSASEGESPPIQVSEADWITKKRRRLDLKAAQSVGLDATKAILLCVHVKNPELFQAKLRALVADSVLAARSAISYLDSGGRPLRNSSSAERRALRARLEAQAIASLEARVPEVEASELEPARDGLDDALNTLVRGSFLLKEFIEARTISPQLADALGSIVRGALLSRDCIRKNRLFHAIGQRSSETTSTETTKRWT